jgi:hypothetical protein
MLSRGVRFKGSCLAYLPGYKLTFNKVALSNDGEGYANIMAAKKGLVEGILYFLSEKQLQLLDLYEGCPRHYERIPVKIYTVGAAEPYDAITYKALTEMTKPGLKPSQNYLNHLLYAGQHFLSKEYYRKLKGTNCYEI